MIARQLKNKFAHDLTKEALLGPVVDALNLGIPSGIGYVVGKGEGREMVRSGEDMDERNILAALFLPGALGYRHGKVTAYNELKNKMKRDAR